MPDINAYLAFNGNCGEAMRYYEKVLGGKLDLMTHGQSPMADQVPPGSADKILHARLVSDGGTLMASDGMPGAPYAGMHGFAVALQYAKPADAKRVFEGLAKGGQVTMPMEKTFWAEAFGMVTDRFGTPWIINGGSTMA